MNYLLTSAGVWMLHTTLGGGLLLLVTCVLMCWTRQPARRQRLGDWGLAAALLVAVLGGLWPSWLVVAWSGGGTSPQAAATADPAATGTDAAVDLAGRDDNNELAALPSSPPAERLALENQTSPAQQPAGRLSYSGMAAMAAATVVGGFFAWRLVLGYVALLRLLWRSQRAPAEVRGLFETMAAGTRWVRLLVSRRLLVPLSCGLLRPTVVLPEIMCQQPTPRQLRWIFAHELTHLRRRDAWSALLFNLGQIFFFAVPWFWWLRRQVRLCQEYVADAAAAEQDSSNVDYAEFLVSLANAPAVPVGASAVSGHCSDLFRRVTMLLKERMRVETRCPRLWNVIVAGCLALLALPVSGFAYRAQAAEDDTIIIIIHTQGEGGAPKVKIKTEKTEPTRFIIQTLDTDKAKAGEPILLWLEDGKLVNKGAPGELKLKVMGDLATAPVVRQIIIRSGDSTMPFAFAVKPGDELKLLQDAVSRLEKLKKNGQLSSEQFHKEIIKVLEKLKAIPVEIAPPKLDNGEVKEKKVERPGAPKTAMDPLGAKDTVVLKVKTRSIQPPTTTKNAAKQRFGVVVEAINPALAEHLKLPANVGLLVVDIVSGSPADKAGIKGHDVLVKIDGTMVPASPADFAKLVQNFKSDTPLEVVVIRKGQMQPVGNVKLLGEDAKQKTVAERLQLLEARMKQAEAQRLLAIEAEKAAKIELDKAQKAMAREIEARHVLETEKAVVNALSKAAAVKDPAGKPQKARPAKITLPPLKVGEEQAKITVTTKGDIQTITQKQGGVTFAVHCIVKDGKWFVGTIEVSDRKTSETFNSILAVPEAYRARGTTARCLA